MFKPCEFRRLDADWLCDAAGLPLKNLSEPGETLEETCAQCSIPDELSRRPCLFMVPVKVWHEGEWNDLFACHWYHAIARDDVLRGTLLCGGCPDWFPRPPREMIYRLLDRTAAMRVKMLRRLSEPPAPPSRPREPAAPTPRPWWRRMIDRVAAWLS